MLLYKFKHYHFWNALLPWLLSAMPHHIVPITCWPQPRGHNLCFDPQGVKSSLAYQKYSEKQLELKQNKGTSSQFLILYISFSRGFLCFSCLRGQVQQNDRNENTEPHENALLATAKS